MGKLVAFDLYEIPKLNTFSEEIRTMAVLASALGAESVLSKAVTIDLEKITEAFQIQRLLFLAARKLSSIWIKVG